MKLPIKGGGDYKIIAAGTYVGRLIRIEDQGTQKTTWDGSEKSARKLRFVWELPNELETFHADKGAQPYLVNQIFTASMHEKASLRRTLEAWRGRAFNEAEAATLDLKKVLGVPAMLSIAHDETGKWANVKSVSALPKGTECPAKINEGWFFDLDAIDYNIWRKLSKGVKIKISLSPEWQSLNLPEAIEAKLNEILKEQHHG